MLESSGKAFQNHADALVKHLDAQRLVVQVRVAWFLDATDVGQFMLVCVGLELFGEQLLDDVVESHCCCIVVFDDRFRQVVRLANWILEKLTKLVDLGLFGVQVEVSWLEGVLELGERAE